MLVAVGIVLLYTRFARWGRRWLTLVLAGYWIVGTPAGSALLARSVAMFDRVETPADARGASAVVMLGGGILTHVAGDLALDDLLSSAPRVLETARVYRLLDRPLVVASGGNAEHLVPPRTEARAYRRALIELGLPADRIVLEEESMTTRDEAVYLKPLLARHGVTRFVLVTSPIHMGRSLGAFRAVGLSPVPSVSALRSGPERSMWSPIPDRDSLLLSDAVIYEVLARLWYRAHGWLDAGGHAG